MIFIIIIITLLTSRGGNCGRMAKPTRRQFTMFISYYVHVHAMVHVTVTVTVLVSNSLYFTMLLLSLRQCNEATVMFPMKCT